MEELRHLAPMIHKHFFLNHSGEREKTSPSPGFCVVSRQAVLHHED